VLEYHPVTDQENQLFVKFQQKAPVPPLIVTSIQEFVTDLNDRFSFHMWLSLIEFNRFNLVGGAVVLCILRNVHRQITSDLDFVYVEKSLTDFIDALVSVITIDTFIDRCLLTLQNQCSPILFVLNYF
jgi:hypothetical protein